MRKYRITVMRMVHDADLMEQYENPIEDTCDMKPGQLFHRGDRGIEYVLL